MTTLEHHPSRARRSIVLFVVFVLLGGWSLQLAAVLHEQLGFLIPLAMFVPLLAVLATKETRSALRERLRRPTPWWTLIAAVFLGCLHTGLVFVLSLAAGFSQWSNKVTVVGNTLLSDGLLFGSGEPVSYVQFAASVLLGQFLGALVLAPLVFGEEAGWRGYLQPELEKRFGNIRATVVVSAVWGAWHWPLMFGGYNSGGSHPVINTVVFFSVNICAMAFVLAWLTRRSRSIWPAVLAHASNNAFPDNEMTVIDHWWGHKLVSLAVAAVVIAAFVLISRVARGRRVGVPRRTWFPRWRSR